MIKPLLLKIKLRVLPYFYGYLAKFTLKLLALTCRFRIDGIEHFTQTASSNKCILMFWHNRLAMIPEIMTQCASQFDYAAMISNSRDGEVIAVLTNSYKNGRAIRVAHNARSKALKTLIQELKKGKEVIIITPDGPRGPVYEVKPGVTVAAMEASASVVPVTWSANRYWKLPTWDGLRLPKPFSTINVKLGEAIRFEHKKKKEFKEETLLLQNALLSLEKNH